MWPLGSLKIHARCTERKAGKISQAQRGGELIFVVIPCCSWLHRYEDPDASMGKQGREDADDNKGHT